MTDEAVETREPSPEGFRDMLAMEMYLDAVFDSNPETREPRGDRRRWGVACCLVTAGRAPTFKDWCRLAQVEIVDDVRDDMDGLNDDGMLNKVPPNTVLTRKNGQQEILNPLTPEEIEDLALDARMAVDG